MRASIPYDRVVVYLCILWAVRIVCAYSIGILNQSGNFSQSAEYNFLNVGYTRMFHLNYNVIVK